jgi:hypothetical protein
VRDGARARRQQRATAILASVNSKSQDEAIILKNKAYLAAADKAISDVDEFKNKGNPSGISKDQLFRAYNLATDSGVSGADLNAAEKKLRQDRAGYEQTYRASVDRSAANDTTRKTGEDFAKQAAKSFSNAVEIRLKLPELQNDVAQQNADESEEESAKAGKEKETPAIREKLTPLIGSVTANHLAARAFPCSMSGNNGSVIWPTLTGRWAELAVETNADPIHLNLAESTCHHSTVSS